MKWLVQLMRSNVDVKFSNFSANSVFICFFKVDKLYADAGDNSRKFKTARKVPGPFALPIFGTRWIYSCFGYYRMNKIHEAYKGKKLAFALIDRGNLMLLLSVRSSLCLRLS